MQTKIKRQCPVMQQSRTASGTASNYINDETRREEDTKLTLKKEPGYFTSSSLRYTIYGRKKTEHQSNSHFHITICCDSPIKQQSEKEQDVYSPVQLFLS